MYTASFQVCYLSREKSPPPPLFPLVQRVGLSLTSHLTCLSRNVKRQVGSIRVESQRGIMMRYIAGLGNVGIRSCQGSDELYFF